MTGFSPARGRLAGPDLLWRSDYAEPWWRGSESTVPARRLHESHGCLRRERGVRTPAIKPQATASTSRSHETTRALWRSIAPRAPASHGSRRPSQTSPRAGKYCVFSTVRRAGCGESLEVVARTESGARPGSMRERSPVSTTSGAKARRRSSPAPEAVGLPARARGHLRACGRPDGYARVRMVREGEPIAIVDLIDDGNGRWLVSMVTGCSSLEQ